LYSNYQYWDTNRYNSEILLNVKILHQLGCFKNCNRRHVDLAHWCKTCASNNSICQHVLLSNHLKPCWCCFIGFGNLPNILQFPPCNVQETLQTIALVFQPLPVRVELLVWQCISWSLTKLLNCRPYLKGWALQHANPKISKLNVQRRSLRLCRGKGSQKGLRRSGDK